MFVQEASTLLSALAVALATAGGEWPAFLPVHDGLRDAASGIAVAGCTTAHYASDSIHMSRLPHHLETVRMG